jgi:adenine-specific DNA-methyltransferase
MTTNNQKLELTWMGKGEQPALEPRLLLLEPEHCEGNLDSDNMLIHGDNLLALKALEQQYAGQVKCIYIDPPYNTGSAFEHYDDGLEHSLWLNLMYHRLELLNSLLAEDGTIFVSIDNNEMSYLQVMMDGIFKRKNRKNIITLKRGSVTGAKVINPGLVNISEFILVYVKNVDKWQPNRLLRKKERDTRYSTFIENYDEECAEWRYIPLMDAFATSLGIEKKNLKKILAERMNNEIDAFVMANAHRIIQFATLDDKSISKEANRLKYESKRNPLKTFFMEREGKKPYYIIDGKLLIFVKDRLAIVDGELSFSEPLTDIWDDVLPNDLHNEGGVEFRKGKKPEKLIQRLFELATNTGDLVLDSFLGSGTTAAVAHKMGRRWIGIELGDHAYTHCLPRLRKVVRGEDNGGITKAVNWTGGGGFKTYRLAESLLEHDAHGILTFNPDFTDEMVAHAVAKIEGYAPLPPKGETAHPFWMQSVGLDKSYLYVTKLFITKQWLDDLSAQMPDDVSLLICCPAYVTGCEKAYNRIKLKKIPQSFQLAYEFGEDDYSLNVNNVMPQAEEETDFEGVDTEGGNILPKKAVKKGNDRQASLF